MDLYFFLISRICLVYIDEMDGWLPNDKNIHDVSYLTIKYILTSI
jgi:hypothetical protein